MRVVFLSPDLPQAGQPSGDRVRALARRDGVEVVLALTAAPPSAGHDVTWGGAQLVGASDAAAQSADVAIALDWRAAAHVFSLDGARPVLLVDEFAHERMAVWQAERVPAAIAYDLPVDVLAGGQWVVDAFAERRPGVRALLAPAPLDREVFAPEPSAAPRPLRVAVDDRWLFEGRPSEARTGLAEVRADHQLIAVPDAPPAERAAVLRGADVLLMLDPAGGEGAAVREAMACGAVPFVVVAGGQAEAVEDGVSGLLVEPDDHRGTARRIERLAGDRALLARLRAGALAAAAARPGPDEAGAALHTALIEALAAPPPEAAAWPARLLGDAIAQATIVSNELNALSGALERVQNDEAYRAGLRVRDAWRGPKMVPVRWAARPLMRRAKGRLDAGSE